MNTSNLKNFAQTARTQLIEQVRVQLQRARSATGALRAGQATALSNLEAQINKDGEQRVVEDAAYRWFNRFVALRFMDVNDYADLRAVSPNDGETLPDLLQLAKARQLPDDLKVDHRRINDLIDRVIPSPDPDAEVYRILLRAECNRRHAQLPFLFQRVDDFSELLLPADLLSQNSILHQLRETLTKDVCKDNEEVIGWLYQFYISEKKDAVFAAKGKVKKEDIPAVTQLFTPRWIVEYMVQNTLGKLWLQSHPDSSLRDHMPYYLESAETLSPGPSSGERGDVGDRPQEPTELPSSAQLSSPTPVTPEPPFTLFPPTIPITSEPSPLSFGEGPGERVLSPQDLTLADQACGSGHILLYAFELLTHIYEESGYTKAEIPGLILTHNLTGFEIDERAAQLAAFTLMMRARRYHRATLRRGSKPNIVRFRDLKIDDGRSVATLLADHGVHPTKELLHDLDLMTQATNLGSLIVPTATAAEIEAARTQVQSEVETSNDLFARNSLRELDIALGQLAELGRRFWCVVDNPPYLRVSKANSALKEFVSSEYELGKTDLMTVFMQRGLKAVHQSGLLGMINQHGWMFLSSFEDLRKSLLNSIQFDTVLHLGPRTFPEISGEVVQSAAFVIRNQKPTYDGLYVRLVEEKKSSLKEAKLLSICEKKHSTGVYLTSHSRMSRIPSHSMGYWVSDKFLGLFNEKTIGDLTTIKSGIMTGKDDCFLRKWYEVGDRNSNLKRENDTTWHKFNKGMGYQKWYQENTFVINFKNSGIAFQEYKSNIGYLNYRLRDPSLHYQPGISWSDVGSSLPSFRYQDAGILFAARSPMVFIDNKAYVSYLNSKFIKSVIDLFNPTLTINVNDVEIIPAVIEEETKLIDFANNAIVITLEYFKTIETTWDFSTNSLISGKLLQKSVVDYERRWSSDFKRLHSVEEKVNLLVSSAVEIALEPSQEIEDITILQQELDRKALAKLNKKLKRDPVTGLVTNYDELELPFKRDVILQQFISYAVGCMMGRYSLDKEGLVLANAGDTLVQYAEKVGKEKEAWTFAPDEDGILPVLAGEYFSDDVVGEFRKFLRAAFGEAHFVENLAFVEECIGKDIRSYFVRDFYKDHTQRYKKRPIYWMFQSPGKHFRALVYLHRYRPDTVGRLLNDYLRPYIDRLNTERHNAQAVVDDAGSSASASNAARKTIETANAAIRDCEVYQKDLLELARQRIDLDLDDGVLVNYNKMGGAVEVITGVNDVKGRKKVRGFDWVDWDWGA
jgi:hypothetical protein